MKILVLFAVLLAITGAWWVGKNSTDALPVQKEESVDLSEPQQQKPDNASDESKSEGEASPAPKVTTDPGTGKSIMIYDGIAVSEGTTVLNVSNRNLSGSLKAEVRFLTNLKELNLSGNNFTGLPAEVGQLSKLEVLNLSNNPFTGLPYELANLKNLKVLDLRGTQYAKQDLEVIKKGLPTSTKILVD